MSWIDWVIVAAFLCFTAFWAIGTQKYTKSVADFLAAGRCAKRYLLTVSEGMAALGAISIVASFELYYVIGFSGAWWYFLMIVVSTVVFLSGWVFYRYRQTRALTLAQFLEIRYSKRFRVFTGVVAWLSGIINFGIFPSVGARFFIYFCGLPDTLATYSIIMFGLISIALFFTFLGGQIAVIVTDFVQGTFCNIMFVVIIIITLCMFKWPQIIEALTAAPKNESMIHPFHTENAQDFSIYFFLIQAFAYLYVLGIWQGNQGYNASALTPHEARMGKILSSWRILALNLFVMIMPICAYTFMNHPDFSSAAVQAKEVLAGIENTQIQKQMTTVIAMRYFIPTGIMGAFVAVMLAAFISTHDTYLHSWGSIFVQDVIMPLRKKPFTPKQHIWLLRASIMGVAIFIYIFSLVFRQTEYILMFFMITGAVFTGGAGIAVIGGLYWKRGTNAGAWSAMITGSVLAVAAIIIKQIHGTTPFTGDIMNYIASQNGAVLSFFASIAAICVYFIVSLLDNKPAFNMDKMLHRGQYVIANAPSESAVKPVMGIKRIIGINRDFNLRDRMIYIATIAWTALLVFIFIFGVVYNFYVEVEDKSWVAFWKYYIIVSLVMSVVTTVWFAVGGLSNLVDMFKMLGRTKRDETDDGHIAKELDIE